MARRKNDNSFVVFLLLVTIVIGAIALGTWWYRKSHGVTAPNVPATSLPRTLPRPAPGNALLLPDPKLTPGAVYEGVTKEDVCTPGYSSKVRNVPESVKRAVYREYGREPAKGVCCEVDHLISLELGGSNDIKNLWPEPYEPRPGAHEKDRVENYLHRQVCSGQMDLAEAQRLIATDWYSVYLQIEGGR